jgi:multidrug resistance protein, MATE family
MLDRNNQSSPQITQQTTLTKACKDTVIFSLPLIGFRSIATISTFIGMLLVASLGHRELAASALVTPIQITINITAWSIIFALPIVAGHAFGAQKFEDIGKILRQSWLVGIILTIPTMLIYWYIGPILRLLGQDPSLVDLAQPYFRVLALGVLPSMFYINFTQFVTGIGKPKIILFFSLLGIVSIVAIAYPLLFGKFGFPRLGMIGMAYSNVAAFCLASIISFIYLALSPHYKPFKIFKLSFNDFHYLKQLLQIGVPMSIQFVTEMLAFSFSIIIIGWINQASLAAAQIINQLNSIFIMCPFGIAQTASVLIGHAQGRGDKHASKTYGTASLLIGLVCSIIIALVYCLFPHWFISLFSVDISDAKNALTIQIAITLFYILAISQIGDSVRNITAGALRGFKDSATPMWVNAGAAWIVGIPGGYWLSIKLHMGAPGMCLAFLIAWFAAVPILLKRFYAKAK